MYNIWFDVASLVLAAVIGYAIVIRKSPRTEQNGRFYIAYLSVLGATIADTLETTICNYQASIHIPFAILKVFFSILSSTYLVLHIYSAVAFICYIRSIFNLHTNRLSNSLRIYLPFVICVTLVIINFSEPIVFKITDNLISHREPMMLAFYVSGAYYLTYTAILILRYMRGISRDKIFSLLSFSILAVSSNIIQLFNQSLRVENFFNMLECFLMYIAIESPLDYIDSQSGLQNENAFYFKVGVAHERHTKGSFLLLTIDNENALDRSLATGVLDSLLIEAGFYLRRLNKKTTVYKIARTNFILDVSKLSQTEIKKIIRRIQERFTRPFHTESYSLVLSANCCSIRSPENAETEEEMRHLISLATDKRIARQSFFITCENLDLEGDNKRKRISTLLRTAIEDNTLSIRYQPIYSVSEKRITGLELKTFITSSTYGLVSGKEFTPLAEQNGTITQISHYALEAACEFVEREHLTEKGVKELQILLPVSELMKAQISNVISEIVDAHHIPRQFFCFEILEETVINYGGIITQSMNELRARGFRFLLDNYGIGYTNMNMLIKMPLQAVALEKSILYAGMSSQKSEIILSCNTKLLNNLNLSVKAKHIETKEQMEYAQKMGFTMLQGYYFSKPLRETEVLEFIGDAHEF